MENLNKSYIKAKNILFTNLWQFEKDCIEHALQEKITKARRFFERKHCRKIEHLSRKAQFPQTETQASSDTDTQSSSQYSESSSQSSQSQTQDNTPTNTDDELLLQESEDNDSDTESEHVTLDEETNSTAEQSDTGENSENPGTDKNNKNRRWIPKSTWRRMKKAELKKQINLVNNLSDLELTENQIKLLNKGLSFSPSPNGVDITHLTADTFHMERNMA